MVYRPFKQAAEPLHRWVKVCCLVLWLPFVANATPNFNEGSRCVILFSLSGLPDIQFQQQIENLNAQLIRKKIGLIDLHRWLQSPPFIQVSGRQKKQLRQHYEIDYDRSIALLLDSNKNEIFRKHDMVDLVDLIIGCR